MVITCFLVIAFCIRFPSDPLTLCQKQLAAAFMQLAIDNKTNVYPNVEGNSIKSFALIGSYIKNWETYITDYGYVPGLTADDPDDLVLMYLKKKTRRTWNGDHSPSIYSPQKWMVLPPGIYHNVFNLKPAYIPDPENYNNKFPEGGLLVETPEFRRRLQKTLGFLKENNRLYWENVIKEHTEFLNAVKE